VRERKREIKEKQKMTKKEKWWARPGLSSCLERPRLAFYPDKDQDVAIPTAEAVEGTSSSWRRKRAQREKADATSPMPTSTCSEADALNLLLAQD